jgi:hypothetical protein
MSWGLQVNDIILSKICKSELQDKFKENEQIITDAKERILMYMAATPRDFVFPESQDMESWEDLIHRELNALLESIKEAAEQNFVIGQILNGDANAQEY